MGHKEAYHVACYLALKCNGIWTNDTDYEGKEEIKVFDTKDMIDFMSQNFMNVVDENDNVIGSVSDEEFMQRDDIITRSAAVFVFNSRGEIFLQKRARNKGRYPLHWEVSVTGKVDSGESYDDAAVREMEEELGIRKDKKELEFLLKKFVKQDKQEFVQVYRTVHDGEIRINKDEIDDGRFFTADKARKLIAEGKVTPLLAGTFEAVAV